MMKRNPLSRLYLIVSSIGFLFSFFSILLYRGISFRYVLFVNEANHFMDFFNSLFLGMMPDPYAYQAVYPPLNYAILHFISAFIPRDLLALGELAVRDSQVGMFVFVFYSFLTTGGALYVIYRNKAGTEWEKVLFTFLCLMSSGFIFHIVRSNMIILSLLFILFFVFGKDSKKPFVRELSLLSLAVAAAIKIYPALFGLVLLKEKRYRESMRTVVYGMLFFFLPFLVTGGLTSGIRQMVENLQNLSSLVASLGFGYSVSFGNTIRLALALAGADTDTAALIARIGTNLLLLAGLGSIAVQKKTWKTYGLITLLIIAYPDVSYQYTLIFMIVPLMLFLDKKEAFCKGDIGYLTLFVCILAPIFLPHNVLFAQLESPYPVTVAIFVESVALMVFTIILIAGGFRNLSLRKRIPDKVSDHPVVPVSTP